MYSILTPTDLAACYLVSRNFYANMKKAKSTYFEDKIDS